MIFDLEATIAATVTWKRDPNADCDVFTTAPAMQDCYGDGHYLCQECGRYQPEED